MKNNKKEPFLYFNFKDHHGKLQPLHFMNPIKILCARTVDEVVPCLEAIDKEVNNGFYAAGYLSYEAASAFEQSNLASKINDLPLLWFGIYKEPIRKTLESSGNFKTDHWNPTVSIDEYYNNIDKIHAYIKNGQTKQVNYTIQLETSFTGDPIAFYKQLEQAQAAHYTAFIDIDDFSILSASPELFFQVKDNKIMTRPMKGTIGRGKTYEEDLQNANWLKHSKKNQYENQLIVDLMKTELAKIAIPHTIAVPQQYEIEKYPTVYQMTSTITADMQPDILFSDIFKSLFPCGSITGFPKSNTMDIISKLEKNQRGIYCGAMGWITPNKEAVFNVPIRTVLIDKEKERAIYGVGGGITKDSIKEEEYKEILVKAKLLTKNEQPFQLLESLGLINGEYIVFNEHIKRLTTSAAYFDFNINIKNIISALNKLIKKHGVGQWKVRLLLEMTGDFSIDVEELTKNFEGFTSTLAKEAVPSKNIFLYHKTTNREIYTKHKIEHNHLFDVLLWNENQEVTEFTMGNIVVEIEGKLYTPPIESGLLAGTFREHLLQKGIIKERKIFIDELSNCENIWFINSVRKWIPVKINL